MNPQSHGEVTLSSAVPSASASIPYVSLAAWTRAEGTGVRISSIPGSLTKAY